MRDLDLTVEQRDAMMCEVEAHNFVADAAELGFPVGEWPLMFKTRRGNKQNFVLSTVSENYDGDISFMLYRQHLGCITLKVFND